jgi:hypothetical protein
MRRAAERVLSEKGYLSAVEVLLAMGRLSRRDYERWRFRNAPHLEAVLPGSLNQHSFFCRQLRAYARDELTLKPSRTAYVSWGKGGRQLLRFSKHGQPHLEEMFSTHYVDVASVARRTTSQTPLPGAGSTTPPPAPPPLSAL